jgi:hypothetical protein
MNESSVPFEGPAVQEPVEIDEPVQDNRTKLIALAAGAGVVVLAVVAYFLLFSGGGSDSTGAVGTPQTPVPAGAPTTAAPAVVPVRHLSSKKFGRDPFKALLVDAVVTTASAGGGTTTPAVAGGPTIVTGVGTTTGGSTTSGSTGTSTGTGTSTSTGTGTSTGTTGGSTTATPVTPSVTSDHSFRVVKVAADQSRISVRVDGKTYSGLKAGQVFASFYKVLVIGGKVNGFQVGDEKFSVLGTKAVHVAM